MTRRVRQALAMTLNREAIVQRVTRAVASCPRIV